MSEREALPICCPHCGGELSLDLKNKLMDESRVSFDMRPHKGELLSASTVGGALSSLDDLYTAVGKEIGVTVRALVEGMSFDGGSVRFDLLLTRSEKGISKRTDTEMSATPTEPAA